MMFWVALLCALLLAHLLTGWLRRYALTRLMLDIPNQRSSHTVPTPRGGGVAIVLVVLAVLPLLKVFNLLDDSLFWAMMMPGTVVALIGWLDDHRGLGVWQRLVAHFTAAALALFLLGGLAPLSMLKLVLDFGLPGYGLGVLFLVWMTNLYNFMDGIDGIAGLETVTVCLGSALLAHLVVPAMTPWSVLLLIAMAAIGFLGWNFPRARIFMGDAGSGFIGLQLGVLALHSGWLTPQLFWSWLILLGVFIVDASVTLMRRLFRGERVHHAHCSHAYQHAARFMGSHIPVALATAAINIFYLLPVATLVALSLLGGLWGVLFTYVPLIYLAVRLGAGIDNAPLPE